MLTVVVAENRAMTTIIGADGRFALRRLPENAFTLIFLSDGGEIGRLVFDDVKPNQALTLTIAVAGSSVTLVEQRRDGMGVGDVEFAGRVEQVLAVNAARDSRFVIDGRTVVARPGQTVIRDGNRNVSVTDVVVCLQVHVKGAWLDLTASRALQEVLAAEIGIQGSVVAPTPPPATGRACIINGGRVGDGIELDGRIAAGTLPVFTMTVDGNGASGPVTIQAGAAAIRCDGPSASPAACPARVVAGAAIHVTGTLSACSASAAEVAAREVRLQN